MLYEVLQAIEQAGGPVTLPQLSRRLGVEESALRPMVDFWVQKGRLAAVDPVPDAQKEDACGGMPCYAACHHPHIQN